MKINYLPTASQIDVIAQARAKKPQEEGSLLEEFSALGEILCCHVWK